MDLRRLRNFVGIVDRGSFNAAANAVNIADSALGSDMQWLEQEFGGALFDRGPRGVALTESGHLLLQ